MLSRNRSDELQDGKMKIVCHQSDLIILSKGRKIENKAPSRKCVVGCFPYSAKTPHFPIRATCTHDFNSKMHLPQTPFKNPKFIFIPIINQATPPAPVQSKLSPLSPFRHGKPLYVVTTSLSPTTFQFPNLLLTSLHTTTPFQTPISCQNIVTSGLQLQLSFNHNSQQLRLFIVRER